MSGLRKWVERRTGWIWGTYRPSGNPWGRTWLVIAPRQGDQAFSVVIGSRGFYVGRYEV